jgi:hypothetical protein
MTPPLSPVGPHAPGRHYERGVRILILPNEDFDMATYGTSIVTENST